MSREGVATESGRVRRAWPWLGPVAVACVLVWRDADEHTLTEVRKSTGYIFQAHS